MTGEAHVNLKVESEFNYFGDLCQVKAPCACLKNAYIVRCKAIQNEVSARINIKQGNVGWDADVNFTLF